MSTYLKIDQFRSEHKVGSLTVLKLKEILNKYQIIMVFLGLHKSKMTKLTLKKSL
jgi:radical SAM superfamily enzyme with C-terminal helix-hairpin-helix motif